MKIRRITAILICVLMLVALLPFSAFAAEDGEDPAGGSPEQTRAEAADGGGGQSGQYYVHLQYSTSYGLVGLTTRTGDGYAYPGEEVKLEYLPNEGFHVQSAEIGTPGVLGVVYYNGTNPIENGRFIMPDHEVYVRILFVSDTANPVRIESDIEHGKLEIEGSRTSFYENETVKLIATPDQGYRLDSISWADDDPNSAIWIQIPGTELSMPNHPIRVWAKFAERPSYTAQALVEPAGAGKVTGAGTFYDDQNVTLTAAANDGFEFLNWTEDGEVVSSEASCTFPSERDRTLTANFRELEFYTITAEPSTEGYGTVSGGGRFREDQTVTVTASANPGYQFINWTVKGKVVSKETQYTFRPTADTTLKANFIDPEAADYPVWMGGSQVTSSYMSGDGWSYDPASQMLSLNGASVNNSYEWSEGEEAFTANIYAEGIDLLIAFENQSTAGGAGYAVYVKDGGLTFTGDGSFKVSKSADGIYADNITIDAGLGITDPLGAQILPEGEGYAVFEPDGSTHAKAFVIEPAYEVKVVRDPEWGGTVTGAGMYRKGAEATLTAAAAGKEDYTFDGWYDENGKLSDDAEYVFMPSKDTSLTAKFVLQNEGLIAGNRPWSVGRFYYGGEAWDQIGAKSGESMLLIASSYRGVCTYPQALEDCEKTYEKLTDFEKAQVLPVSKTEAPYTYDGKSYDGTTLVNANMFLLSVQEAAAYGFLTSPGMWWLRSPIAGHPDYRAAVFEDGSLTNSHMVNTRAFRSKPVFRMDPTSIWFMCDAFGGKPDATEEGDFGSFGSDMQVRQKLTFYDENKTGFSADVDGKSSVSVRLDGSFTLHYSGAAEGDVVSAMIETTKGKRLYYASKVQDETGLWEIRMPDDIGFGTGTYVLKVFSEERNGGTYSDCAGVPVTIDLTVTDPLYPADGTICGIPASEGGVLYVGGIPWNIIGIGDEALLLISSEALGTEEKFSDASAFADTVFESFSPQEQSAVPETFKKEGRYYENETEMYFSYDPAPLKKKRMFLLSAEETVLYLSEKEDRLPGRWWLRSPEYMYGANNCYGIIDEEGNLDMNWLQDDKNIGIRPAFRLSQAPILLLSDAAGSKSSSEAGSGEFGMFRNPAANGAKLTLIDEGRAGFEADVQGADTVTTSKGSEIKVNYRGAIAGYGMDGEQFVSAALLDADGTVLYYASIRPDKSGSGTWTLTIPDDNSLAEGSYQLKIFSEQQNEAYDTDYASEPAVIGLTIAPYFANGEGEILVKADLEGRAWDDADAFTFTLSADEGTPMPSENTITITKDDHDGTKSFGKIPFSESGTYTYTIKQTAGDLAGVAYDQAEKTVTLSVRDDKKGNILAEEGSALQNTVEFNNTYAAYRVTASASPREGGTVYGNAQEYPNGTTASVAATAKPGYAFVNWTENGKEISRASRYRFEISSARRLVANFSKVDYKITKDAEHASLTAAETARYQDEVEVSAVPDAGYELTKIIWKAGDGEETDITEKKSFTMPADNVTIKIYTTPIKYTVTFVDEDGTPLETNTELLYDETPVYSGKTPEKEEDAAYYYTFGGWDPQIARVTEDAQYKAVYDKTARKYAEPVWTWTGNDEEGYTSAEATVTTCDGKKAFTFTGTDDQPEVKRTEPTVTEDGSIVYTAAVTLNDVTYTGTKTIVLDAEKDYRFMKGQDSTWTKGTEGDFEIIVKATAHDDETFAHFAGLLIDGAEAPEKDDNGNVNYTAKPGSVVISIQSRYLETLAVGKHTVTVRFDDAEDFSFSFTIEPKAVQPSPTSSPGKSAQTGDANAAGGWIALILLSALGMAAAFTAKKRAGSR